MEKEENGLIEYQRIFLGAELAISMAYAKTNIKKCPLVLSLESLSY